MTDIILTTAKNHRYLGAYHPNEPEKIYLNISEIWQWAAEHSPKRATQDDIEEWFTKKLNGIHLQELVCTVKHADKLRIKGGCCNPFCRHEHLVDMMISPDEWNDIRSFHQKKRVEYAQEV